MARNQSNSPRGGSGSFPPGDDGDRPFTVLLAESGDEDVKEFEQAWIGSGTVHPLETVRDADSCMDYLHERMRVQEGAAGVHSNGLPGFIVLDLELSRMRGLDVLREIKLDPALRRTPVIVVSRTTTPELVDRAYELGASAFIRKPEDPLKLQDYVTRVVRFWDESETPLSTKNLR